MSDVIHGTCDGCGKVYRVPSADRTYACKACGGTVRPGEGASASDAQPATQPVRPVAAKASSGVGVPPVKPVARARVGAPASPAAPQRREYRPKKRSLWTPVLGVIAVLVVSAMIVRTYARLRFDPGEQDLNVLTEDFVSAWNASDYDDLAEFSVSQGRDAFRERIEAIARNRKWSELPEPTAWAAAAHESGLVGAAILQLGEDEVEITWARDPISRRWSVVGLDLPPPPLGDRPEAFRGAWARSDPAALNPFFRPETAEKMAALVTRETARAGWGEAWPPLGPASLVPSANRAGAFDARHPVGGGSEEFLVRWVYREAHGGWVVTGFKFP